MVNSAPKENGTHVSGTLFPTLLFFSPTLRVCTGRRSGADFFSGVDRSDPYSIRYGAPPRAQTFYYKAENSLTVMSA